MGYTHLSLAERYYIELERKREKSLNKIASDLGRSQSTVSWEVKRNTGLRGYRYQQANNKALQRLRITPKLSNLLMKLSFLSVHAYAIRRQRQGVFSSRENC